METREVFFLLIRKALGAWDGEVPVKPEMLPELFDLSDAHDLSHLLGQALSDLGLLGEDEISRKFQKRALQAVYRYSKQNCEYERICAVLEEEQIPYIPLKGAVMRKFYPEGWMRSSGDIDILVKPADVEAAAAALEKKAGYTRGKKAAYDLVMHSESGVCLELHFDTMEESRADSIRRVLADLWEQAAPEKPGASCYVLKDELFYFYHIAHMVRHFEAGGCGVRPFLDIWFLNGIAQRNVAAREELLREGGLLTFAWCAEKLTHVWMDAQKMDETSELLEQYVLRGGVYGSVGNFVAVNQSKTGGKTKFLLSKVFLPYETMRQWYPLAKKSKWLLPVAYIQRVAKHLFGGMGRLRAILWSNAAMPEERKDAVTALLEQLDLPK